MLQKQGTNNLTIGILHYHLLKGGVHTVIMNALRSLIAAPYINDLQIDIMTSDAKGPFGSGTLDALADWACQSNRQDNVQVNLIQIDQLAYNRQPAPSIEQLYRDATTVADAILNAMQLANSSAENPYVLHVHNVNLGKNPRLTLAIKLLAERFEQQNIPAWILYQMHDFAEDNRPADWNALRHCSGKQDIKLAVEMMYPTSNRILWACINSADRQRLISIGLDANRITILPNAVDIEAFSAAPLSKMSVEQLEGLELAPADFASELINRIAQFARQNQFHFDPERKILLSPVKAIRRKNIIESILLLILWNYRQDEYQLLITLPANSSADRDYCSRVENFVKQHQLPVVVGFGHELLEPGRQRQIENGKVLRFGVVDLAALSHAIVTTSIQEGFGYVFHEPWLANKAVLGRNIPRVTHDFIAEGMKLEHLYQKLLIPKGWIDNFWPELANKYVQKLQQMQQHANIIPTDESLTIEKIDDAKLCQPLENTNWHIDWADLDVDAQLFVLKEIIQTPAMLEQLIDATTADKNISHWHNEDIRGIITHNCEVVSNKYNLAANAARLTSLIRRGNGLLNRGRSTEQQARVTSNHAIFADCLDLASMRLLT